jgi:syntaxin 5
VIKQDIAALNQQITMLSQLRQTGSESQLEQHSSNVITLLQSRLANTSMTFKHVLETRTEQMRHSRDRRQQLTGQDPPISTSSASSSYLMERSDSVTIDIPSQQLAMIPNQYIEERHSAIESIEATIAELGSIFQQLAHMVAEQNDTIQRIEANVDDMEMNISGAQRELLKLYQHVTSNRWLMIRIFIILIIFFFLFVVVM